VKRISSFILILLLLTAIFSIDVSAHSVYTGLTYGSSITGWGIFDDGSHWPSHNTAITVNSGDFGSNHAFYTFINNAVTDWNSQTFNDSKLLTMSLSSTGAVKFFNKTGLQFQEIGKDLSTWGCTFVDESTKLEDEENAVVKLHHDGNQHHANTPGNIVIWVNWGVIGAKNISDNARNHTARHEIGHAIGLEDMSVNDFDKDYPLMCNDFGKTVTAPSAITARDRQGASAILGQHTHAYTYAQHSETQHKKTCNLCFGYAYENHTFSGATCTKCSAPTIVTVTLNKNGGSGGTNSVKGTYNQHLPTTNVTMPTRPNYTFAGYFDKAVATPGENQYYTSTGASVRTWNKDVDTILYARWTQRLTYNANNGCTWGRFFRFN